MALVVSETFRDNCYDLEKEQRIALVSNGIILSNEDIDVDSKVTFNLACMTGQQVQFGETPTNTIGVTVLNEDGRISASDITGKEFSCKIGVEVANGAYNAPSHAISAIDTGEYMVSVHSEAPYIRGNCTFASTISELENGDACKIMFVYGTIFFVVDDGTNRYYAKHTETSSHSYGAYATPSDMECAMLDRIMDSASYDAVAYYNGGMKEFTYREEYVEEGEWESASGNIVYITDALAHSIPSWIVGIGMTPSAISPSSIGLTTWGQAKNLTWLSMKSHTWGDLSGYSIFDCLTYESKDMGMWHFDRPRRINTAVLTISGKDRMTAFDIDSANFASTASNTALTVREMIFALASYAGVPVGDLSGLNELADEIVVDPTVYYNSKSLKDLLSYCGEVGGVCMFFDRWGNLTCNNSDNTPIALPYCYSFDVADYTAHTVGKMLVFHQGDFFEYQEDDTVLDGATYEWGDNPYFNKSNPTGSWFSEDMHKKYGGFRNAITVTEADYSLWCDDVYSWTDENNVTYREPIFAMTIEWNGSGRVTYENYGEEVRPLEKYDKRIESVSSVNDNNLQGLNKAQYANRLYFDENGLTVESRGLTIKNEDGKGVFAADENGNLVLEGIIRASGGNVGNWDIENNNLKCVNQDDENDYIILGKNNGIPGFEMSATARQTSSGVVSYHSKFTAQGMMLYEDDENVANLTYVTSSRGRQLTLFSKTADTSADNVAFRVTTPGTEIISPYLYFSHSFEILQTNIPSTAGTANAVMATTGLGTRKLYLVSSLRKYKDNIKTIENPTEKVDNLRGVTFTSKCEVDDPNQVFYGFIAEEVQEAVPELASYADGELQSVQYDRVCALLVEDLKACHKRIAELESRMAELEKRLK